MAVPADTVDDFSPGDLGQVPERTSQSDTS